MRPWEKRSLEAKNVRRAARYRYLRDVCKLDPQAANQACHSVKAMLALVPNHEFPPELTERLKKGPAVVYGPRSKKTVERQQRYADLRALGMDSSMASEGCYCDGSFHRVKREWLRLQAALAANDVNKGKMGREK